MSQNLVWTIAPIAVAVGGTAIFLGLRLFFRGLGFVVASLRHRGGVAAMNVPPGPWNRLKAKQKGALLIALIAIVVAIGSIEGRQNGLELTNPGLTLPPAVTSSTTTPMPTTSSSTTTTAAPTTTTALPTTTLR